MRRLALLLPLLLLALAVPAVAQGPSWRPTVSAQQTDAEWLLQLDRRLAPIHGTLADTFAILNGPPLAAEEVDAYVAIVQQQAIKGLVVLDAMAPPRSCASDYWALETTMFLLWGDVGDIWAQARAGSLQAQDEVAAMVPAAAYLMGDYGTRVHDASVCTPPKPAPTVSPSTTPTPRSSPTAEAS